MYKIEMGDNGRWLVIDTNTGKIIATRPSEASAIGFAQVSHKDKRAKRLGLNHRKDRARLVAKHTSDW